MASPLQRRLQVLQATGDCCNDLPGLVAAARADGPGRREQYAALGDERRHLIARMLRRRPGLCGCEIQAALELSHATVSHHMAILQAAGLVEGRRDGKWVRYHLQPDGQELLS